MSTNRLLNLTVLAELTFTAFTDLSAHAGEPKAAPSRSAPATVQPKAHPEATRPLTAKDVWGHDYAQARQQAKALNRPVLVHFHATWCGPCQQMESTVLNTNDVLKEINSRCVAIKVDSDRDPNLVQQFGVNALPCDVLVGTDGKVVKVNEGAVSADQYKALISNVACTKAAAPANVKVASH
jgi:thioredoxin-like negative regulator of GroEL